MFTVCAAVAVLAKLYIVAAPNSETVVAKDAKFNVPINPVLNNAKVPLVCPVAMVPEFNVKVALVALPTVIVVAAPAKLTVVALVLIKLNVPVVGVVILVVISGLVNAGPLLNTTKPVPVSSVKVFSNDALDAVVKNVAILPANPVIPVEAGTVTLISAEPSNA